MYTTRANSLRNARQMRRYNQFICPYSIVVEHVLGKDEAQVRFLLRAPGITRLVKTGLFIKVALALG